MLKLSSSHLVILMHVSNSIHDHSPMIWSINKGSNFSLNDIIKWWYLYLKLRNLFLELESEIIISGGGASRVVKWQWNHELIGYQCLIGTGFDKSRAAVAFDLPACFDCVRWTLPTATAAGFWNSFLFNNFRSLSEWVFLFLESFIIQRGRKTNSELGYSMGQEKFRDNLSLLGWCSPLDRIMKSNTWIT